MTIKEALSGPAVQEYAQFVAAADAAGRAAVAEWYAEQVDPTWFDRTLSELGVQ